MKILLTNFKKLLIQSSSKLISKKIKVLYIKRKNRQFKIRRTLLLYGDEQYSKSFFLKEFLENTHDVKVSNYKGIYYSSLSLFYWSLNFLKFSTNLKKDFNITNILVTKKLTIKEVFLLLYFYPNALVEYIPYSLFADIGYELQFNMPFHSFLYKHYLPTEYALKIGKRFQKINPESLKVIGSPVMFTIYEKSQAVKRKSYPNKLKILWCPHHTIEEIEDGPYWSCFEIYKDFFLRLASEDNVKSKYEICLRPHPALKYKVPNFNNYLIEWEKSSSGFIDHGDYIESFIWSDCMIHDSSSFIHEYLCTNKPVCFTWRKNRKYPSRWHTPHAKKSLKLHTIAFNERDIGQFISKNLINLKSLDFDSKKIPKHLSEYIRKNKKLNPIDLLAASINK